MEGVNIRWHIGGIFEVLPLWFPLAITITTPFTLHSLTFLLS
jgi:hypothetical protein